MTGTNALVVGIANEHSYAFHIAKSLKDAGANLLFTHLPGEKMERRVRKAVDALGIEDPWLMPLDAASDDDLDAVFAKVGADFGRLDVLVHSMRLRTRTTSRKVGSPRPREMSSRKPATSARSPKLPWRTARNR